MKEINQSVVCDVDLYPLALRTVPFILGSVLLLLIVGTPEEPDPLLTLLLCHCELVNVTLHVSGT